MKHIFCDAVLDPHYTSVGGLGCVALYIAQQLTQLDNSQISLSTFISLPTYF